MSDKKTTIGMHFAMLVDNPAWEKIRRRANETIQQHKDDMFAAEDRDEAEILRLKAKYNQDFWEHIEHYIQISAAKK